MTMKVLIPACNMESRLRNKYVFYRTACHSALFVRVCVQGGGWVAGVCPRVRELGVRFRSGGAVCLHTRGARVCVCARARVCAHGGWAPCGGRACRCSIYSRGRVAVHIWLRVFIYAPCLPTPPHARVHEPAPGLAPAWARHRLRAVTCVCPPYVPARGWVAARTCAWLCSTVLLRTNFAPTERFS